MFRYRVKEILSWYAGENPGVLTNIARMLNHGRLAGTGRLVILPVDQGFEHGPARSFAPNPEGYDARYHFRLALDAGCNAYAAPLGFLEGGAAEFAGEIPLILKLNNHDSMAPDGKNPAPSYPSVEDAPPPGRGPLAGIAAAYGATGRADLFVLACDYPAAGTPLLRAILTAAADEDDLVMPVDPAGRDHPLVALWRRRCESVVREALGANRLKVASLFPDFAIRRLHLDALPGEDGGRALVNVNWPEDLAAFDLH